MEGTCKEIACGQGFSEIRNDGGAACRRGWRIAAPVSFKRRICILMHF
jgi:hypothetical protein